MREKPTSSFTAEDVRHDAAQGNVPMQNNVGADGDDHYHIRRARLLRLLALHGEAQEDESEDRPEYAWAFRPEFARN